MIGYPDAANPTVDYCDKRDCIKTTDQKCCIETEIQNLSELLDEVLKLADDMYLQRELSAYERTAFIAYQKWLKSHGID